MGISYLLIPIFLSTYSNGYSDISKILDGKELVISVISELELKSFPNIKPKEVSIVDELIKECQVINLNQEVKNIAIEIRRTRSLKLPDAIVAASAYYSKLPIFTGDKQFEKIEELDVIIYEV